MRDKILLSLAIITISFILCPRIWEVEASVSSPIDIGTYGTVSYSQQPGIRDIIVSLDGSGDFTDIQSAIDAVPDGEHANILVKQGIYILNPVAKWYPNNIVVKSGITLYGEGIGNTVIQMASTPDIALAVRYYMVVGEGITDFTLKDLTIDQNAPEPDNAGGQAIVLSGSNILLDGVRITNSFGAAISLNDFSDVTIIDCDVSNVWTGIGFINGDSLTVSGSSFSDIKGNGINYGFSSYGAQDVDVDSCYFSNVGDTGIGLANPGEITNVKVSNSFFDDAFLGFSNVKNLWIEGNTITHSASFPNSRFGIYTDSSQGHCSNVNILNNVITTHTKRGIAVYNVDNGATIAGNTITMLPSTESNTVGIVPVRIFGTNIIEDNSIEGGDYSIYWEGWAPASSSPPIIRGNSLLDFNVIGIYDGGQNQGNVLIEDNIIWDRNTPFVSQYGIKTDITNYWIIRNNIIYAGTSGFISAPTSTLVGNVFEPPQ